MRSGSSAPRGPTGGLGGVKNAAPARPAFVSSDSGVTNRVAFGAGGSGGTRYRSSNRGCVGSPGGVRKSS